MSIGIDRPLLVAPSHNLTKRWPVLNIVQGDTQKTPIAQVSVPDHLTMFPNVNSYRVTVHYLLRF